MFILYKDLCYLIQILNYNVYKYFHYVNYINNIKHLFKSSINYDHLEYYEFIKIIFKKNIFKISINNIEYMFLTAAEYGLYGVIKTIIIKDISNNIYNYAIRLSSRRGHYKIVKYLLKKTTPRINPGSYYNYSIRWASRKGHYKIVKLLLKDKRIDPSDEDNCAIKWAYKAGHEKIIKLLSKDKRVKKVTF
jgi:ankyrin repeat protein